MWEMHHEKPLPDEATLETTCGTLGCVEPEHLRPVKDY
jgi:hypothetical protein